MKLFLKYLYCRRFSALAFALFAGAFAFVFSLYELPAEAIIYACGLCVCIAAVFVAVGFIRFRAAYNERRRLTDPLGAMIEALPETSSPEERQYNEAIEQLRGLVSEARQSSAESRTEMLDYFTRWVHQIKIPISVMRMELDLSETEQSRSLSAELFRIEQYVGMVLGYFRLDETASDLLAAETDIDGIIRQSIRKYAPLFIAKRLKLSYAGTNVTAVTDGKWLGFIIEQLLSNAVKYTENGGVAVEVSPEREITVSDTGAGIPAEDIPRIFERGYTGSPGRSDSRSTGLGLYLAGKACKRLGAEIEVKSRVGEGTKVSLRLPERIAE